ncbi:unnamed protein product [Microthlaspi erraticum]|uniref:F-box domain-containing protein n=1 Tax=Microthlaspi erraticum TaxID=1685480 RepID=A0A6D2J161_9BRAS|nr:unnamed protein product [Microthlaspi erraticum]
MPSKRKRKKEEPSSPTQTQQSSPFLSLPYDLLLDCVARVSRLYYPTLSLVCKRFRSLLASPELYKARSLSGNTERCLYVCIRRHSIDSRWYTLWRKPDKTLNKDDTKSKPTDYALARVPFPESTQSSFEGLVAVGSSIYQIAQSAGNYSVSVLDCRSHTCREAPSYPVKLWTRSASVVDQKIYVPGRVPSFVDGDSVCNMFHVLDTETQVWDPLPPPRIPCKGGKYSVFGTACIDGKFHAMTSSDVDAAYNSKEGRWDVFSSGMSDYMIDDSYCVIGNVLYSASRGKFRWYDREVHEWRGLNGLVGLPKLGHEHEIRLADYGGNMVVFWNQYLYRMSKIWCAEVSLERRRESCGIWGKVEWLDQVGILPAEVDLIKVLALTV